MRLTATATALLAVATLTEAKGLGLRVDGGLKRSDVPAASKEGQDLLSKARRVLSSNYENYMNDLSYYTGTRDSNWHYTSGRYSNYYGEDEPEMDDEYWETNEYNSNKNWNNYDPDAEDDDGSNSEYRSYGGSGYGAGEAVGDTSWMTDYSIKFDGCATDYTENGNGQVHTETLAKFKLCPNKYGNRCRHAGQYVVPLTEFVQSFKSFVATDQTCRLQQETCYTQCQYEAYQNALYADENEDGGNRKLGYNYGYNSYYNNGGYNNNNNGNNGDDGSNYNNNGYNNNGYNNNGYNNGDNYNNNGYNNNGYNNGEDGNNGNYGGADEYGAENNWSNSEYSCYDDCMIDAGMGYCEDKQLRTSSGDGSYGTYQNDVQSLVPCRKLHSYTDDTTSYWLGGSCRNGGVYLDIFTESTCSHAAPQGSQEDILGYNLPVKNLVTSDLVPCANYNGVCNGLYFDAGKCEKHMHGISQKHNGGCSYMRHMNDNAIHKWMKAVASVLLVACVAMGAYIFYLRRQGKATSLSALLALKPPSQSSLLPRKPASESSMPVGDSHTVVSDESASSYEKMGTEKPKKTKKAKAGGAGGVK